MGKTFKTILRQFTAPSEMPSTEDVLRPRVRGGGLRDLAPEQRRAILNLAHTTRREGLMVFMSKDTVTRFAQVLQTEHVTPRLMRQLLEEIAKGRLVLTAPTVAHKKPAATPTRISNGQNGHDLTAALSVDQLSAGLPFTIKQAARILNVNPNKLYSRCATGRIHYERDGKRYFIPATEVARLQVIGL